MKIVKYRIFILLLIFFPFSILAQITHTASGNVDKKAVQLLHKAAKVFENNAVSFSVTMVSLDSQKKEKSRVSSQVLYKKGRYRATVAQQVIYSDGKSVWHWNKEVNEVVVNPLTDDDDNLMNPAYLLKSYEKKFRPKYIRIDADGTAVVDLQPKKNKSYHKLRLFITERNGQLQRMEIHNYDGSRSEFRLSNFKTGVRCSDADFVFDATTNKDVEIIDMR